MRGGIRQHFSFVVTACDELARREVRDDGADRHVSVLQRLASFRERDAHQRVQVDDHHTAASASRNTRSTVPRSMPCSPKRNTSS
jgi:hypothetical protein